MNETVQSSRPPLPEVLHDMPIVAIMRRMGFDQALRAGAAMASEGIRALEVTFDSPDVLELLGRLRDDLPDVLIGVGTVLSVSAAAEAIDAGARFLVCPHVNTEIISHAVANEIPVFPGAATATEVVVAWDAGATAVKLFPANLLTPATVRALREPLPHVPLMAVGGIDDSNAGAFFAAGAEAIGVGAWLLGGDDATEITRRAASLAAIVRRRP